MTSPSSDLMERAFAALQEMEIPPVPELPAPKTEPRILLDTSSSNGVSPRLKSVIQITRSLIMNRYVRVATAATVTLGLTFWLFGPGNSLSVYAQIAQAVQRHRIVKYTESTEIFQLREDGTSGAAERKIVDTVYEHLNDKIRRTENDEVNGLVDITDRRLGKRLILWHTNNEEADAVEAKLTVSDPNENAMSLLDELESLKSLAGEGIQPLETAKEQLNGTEVTVYRRTINDGTRLHSAYTWWVDNQSNLPVQVEIRFNNSDHNVRIWTNFQWDPQIANEATLFSTTPPEGAVLRTGEDFRSEQIVAYSTRQSQRTIEGGKDSQTSSATGRTFESVANGSFRETHFFAGSNSVWRRVYDASSGRQLDTELTMDGDIHTRVQLSDPGPINRLTMADLMNQVASDSNFQKSVETIDEFECEVYVRKTTDDDGTETVEKVFVAPQQGDAIPGQMRLPYRVDRTTTRRMKNPQLGEFTIVDEWSATEIMDAGQSGIESPEKLFDADPANMAGVTEVNDNRSEAAE